MALHHSVSQYTLQPCLMAKKSLSIVINSRCRKPILQGGQVTPAWKAHMARPQLKASHFKGFREFLLRRTGTLKLFQRGERLRRSICSLDVAPSLQQQTFKKDDLRFEGSDLGKLTLEGAKFTTLAHQIWKQVIRPGDVVVDATCGNGHDTLEMARLAITWQSDSDSMIGTVVALDKQAQAVANTRVLLERSLFPAELERVKMECICHSQLRSLVLPSSVRLVAFNLGYLPGGDKEFITRRGSTVEALEASAEILVPGGLISIVAYVGHPEAWEEFEGVKEFAARLSTTMGLHSPGTLKPPSWPTPSAASQKECSEGLLIAEVQIFFVK